MTVRVLLRNNDTTPDITYKVTLDEVVYDIRVKYLQRLTNEATDTPIRADEFMVEIGLSGADPIIISSLKTNRDVLVSHRYKQNAPQGVLFLRDIIADKSAADGGYYYPERVGLETIGDRFELWYIPRP